MSTAACRFFHQHRHQSWFRDRFDPVARWRCVEAFAARSAEAESRVQQRLASLTTRDGRFLPEWVDSRRVRERGRGSGLPSYHTVLGDGPVEDRMLYIGPVHPDIPQDMLKSTLESIVRREARWKRRHRDDEEHADNTNDDDNADGDDEGETVDDEGGYLEVLIGDAMRRPRDRFATHAWLRFRTPEDAARAAPLLTSQPLVPKGPWAPLTLRRASDHWERIRGRRSRGDENDAASSSDAVLRDVMEHAPEPPPQGHHQGGVPTLLRPWKVRRVAREALPASTSTPAGVARDLGRVMALLRVLYAERCLWKGSSLPEEVAAMATATAAGDGQENARVIPWTKLSASPWEAWVARVARHRIVFREETAVRESSMGRNGDDDRDQALVAQVACVAAHLEPVVSDASSTDAAQVWSDPCAVVDAGVTWLKEVFAYDYWSGIQAESEGDFWLTGVASGYARVKADSHVGAPPRRDCSAEEANDDDDDDDDKGDDADGDAAGDEDGEEDHGGGGGGADRDTNGGREGGGDNSEDNDGHRSSDDDNDDADHEQSTAEHPTDLSRWEMRLARRTAARLALAMARLQANGRDDSVTATGAKTASTASVRGSVIEPRRRLRVRGRNTVEDMAAIRSAAERVARRVEALRESLQDEDWVAPWIADSIKRVPVPEASRQELGVAELLQCVHCKKHFRGESFAERHLLSKHVESLAEERVAGESRLDGWLQLIAADPWVWAMYAADAERPMPPSMRPRPRSASADQRRGRPTIALAATAADGGGLPHRPRGWEHRRPRDTDLLDASAVVAPGPDRAHAPRYDAAQDVSFDDL